MSKLKQYINMKNYMPIIDINGVVKPHPMYRKLKFSFDRPLSYSSMLPAYCYTEQFSNNIENYNEGTQWFGIFFAVVSGIFFTISSAFVKGIKSVDPMVLLSFRAIVQIIMMLIVAHKESKNIFGPKDYRLLNQFQVCNSFFTFSK